jgi:hypothetical protein
VHDASPSQRGYLLLDETPRQAEVIRKITRRDVLILRLQGEKNKRAQCIVKALRDAHG